MTGRIAPRLGAASGLLYVAGLFAGGFFGGDTGRRVELLGMLFFLPFLGFLYGVLRRAEGGHGWLSPTVLAAGLAGFAIKVASAAPLLAADDIADGTPLHEALVSMNDISFILTMLPLGVFAAAVAAVTLKTRVLPLWLGWLAAVAAPALLVNGLFFRSEDGPAFLLLLLWVVAASITLTVRGGAGAVPAADRATFVEAMPGISS
jgi:hypothetical protein